MSAPPLHFSPPQLRAPQHKGGQRTRRHDERPLLAAQWRQLAMLNFAIDPAVLEPLVPAGAELDDYAGATYASIVGFMFLDSRLYGVRIPLHGAFEEVNLRFYVRRRVDGQVRRAVVFVRELAPRRAVAWIANLIYAEHYLTVPMTHHVEPCDGNGADARGAPPRLVEYGWRHGGRWGRVAVECEAPFQRPAAGSLDEFIAEHYWAYTAWPDGGTRQYRVAHPPWQISPAVNARLDCDAAALYGPRLAPFLQCEPASAFLADGSPVRVYRGVRI